jgi:PAS domain S-box-containing protein
MSDREGTRGAPTPEEPRSSAEESFRALLDLLPDGVVVHREGRVVYANATAARVMRVESPAQLVGVPLMESVHPDSRPVVLERIRTMMATGTPVAMQRERMVRRDGTSFDAEVVALPLRFEGKPSFVAVARDVTERDRLQQQLLQTERLASVGMLAAGVAHEVNNPLAYALLNLEQASRQLAAEAPDLDAVRAAVRDAADGARRVQTIVRDLRTFARGAGDDVRSVDVNAVVETALHLVGNELGLRARVERVSAPVARVLANADRLAQVLVNLLMNAAQALPEGRANDHVVRVTTRQSEGLVRVAVSDTGAGISPELLPRLFDPFFTTKPPGMGTGLGLAICHSIVASFGGRIEVTSQVGVGSAFTVILPANALSSAPPAVDEEEPVARGDVVRRRVLVVEDERNMRTVLDTLLSERFEVTAVATGQEAQTVLAADDGWDIILCDLLMPVVSGMDLHDWLRARDPRVADRMVFMTGGAYTDRAIGLLDASPGRWIEKPFEFDALAALLDQVIAARTP